MKAKLLFLILSLSAIPVAGQTQAEIEKAYGKPTLAYAVSEHVWMTPDFAADGQVCRMRFYSRRVIGDAAYLHAYLNFPELKSTLNKIVPPSQRGKRMFSFPLSTSPGGGLVITEYEYEKVSFTFSSSIHLNIGALKNDDFVLLDESDEPLIKLPEPPPPSEDDFLESTKAEVVILHWPDRACAQDRKNGLKVQWGAAEIERQFGKPEKIYSVRDFNLTAAFADNGQVCQIWLYPRRVSGNQSYVGSDVIFDDLSTTLTTLIPPEERGLKQQTNFGVTATGGNRAWTTYPYEKVSFTFLAPPSETTKATDSEQILRRGEFIFPYSPSPVLQDRSPSKDDFHKADDVAIVVIQWEQRKCASP